MKKIIIIALIFHILLALLVLIVLSNNSSKIDIENNIVMIEKKAEILSNHENEIQAITSNPEKTIFTWFFIDNKTIITVAHWVNNFDSIYIIKNKFWEEFQAYLIQKDTINDIAYLELSNNYKRFSEFNYAPNIQVWEKVYWINYLLEKKEGIISNIQTKKISSNIIFEEWYSWGPLLNEKNEIIWINIEVDLVNDTSLSLSF